MCGLMVSCISMSHPPLDALRRSFHPRCCLSPLPHCSRRHQIAISSFSDALLLPPTMVGGGSVASEAVPVSTLGRLWWVNSVAVIPVVFYFTLRVEERAGCGR